MALAHADFEEAFYADSVNLSIGGLSMRAPFLPDVGERLVCRFTVPSLGEVVEAESEVVWSQDTGSQSGEFGLRFLQLDAAAESAIKQIIASENAYIPPQPGKSGRDGDALSLILDGVSAPILGTVIQRDASGLTIEQALPFLRLSTGVTISETGRRGIVQSVDLLVEGDTPRLVVDVAYVSAESVDLAHDEDEDEEEDTPEAPPTSGYEDDEDSVAESFFRGHNPEDTVPDTAMPLVARSRDDRRGDSTELFRTDSVAPMSEEDAEIADLAASMKRSNKQLEAAMARVQPVAQWLGEKLKVLLAQLWVLVKRGSAKSMPMLRDASRTAVAVGGRVGQRIGETATQVMQKRARRRTTEPVFDSNVVAKKKQAGRAVEIRPNRRRGAILLGMAAAVTVVGLGYALWPAAKSAEEPAVAEAAPAPAEPITGDHQVDPLPEDVVAQPAAEPVAQAAAPTGGPAVIPLDSLPTPSATRTAGPMAEPTFPSPRSGVMAKAQTMTASMAAAMPATVVDEAPVIVENMNAHFGAVSVPGGRVFHLRMSRPVESLTGTADAGGFTVIIPNSLSLDRAGPIAQAHPGITQSTILNRGDHSELTIRFEAGRTPKYRVAAVGSELEITLGN